MSRIGKKPVSVPEKVKVNVANRVVTIESGSNKLSFTHRPEVTVKHDAAAKAIIVERKDDERQSKALHGLTRAVINNMVAGVTKGFVKELELVGVGWSMKMQGAKIVLNVGYADPKEVAVPPGVKVEIAGQIIKVSGPDRQKVGQVAAEIRSQRPPEPYNGKGIKYVGENIIRKQGKQFAAGGAA